MYTKLLLLFLFITIGSNSFAQSNEMQSVAENYIQTNYSEWNVLPADVTDLKLIDQYKSKHNGVTHLYYTQRHQGIEIYNAILNINISKEGKVFHVGNRLIHNAAEKINTTEPSLSAVNAVESVAAYFDLPVQRPEVKKQNDSNAFTFEKGSISNSDIPVKLSYQLMEDGQLQLAWKLDIDMIENSDYWSLRVDALTGEVLDKNNYTVYCDFPEHEHGFLQTTYACRDKVISDKSTQEEEMAMMQATDGTYRVFELPIESPIFGDRTLAIDPFDPIASPNGWHTTIAANGATTKHTITRGNNVHAYLDLNNNDFSQNDEPDGGADLIFDFPYSDMNEPSEQREAAVTNLFYMNNRVHDITYQFGFDEAAGNFQNNNFGKGGAEGDYVNAQAQDGSGTNNANFSTPADGGSGRMQMFLWGLNSRSVYVNAPTSIEGWYETGSASFGIPVDQNTNITGEIHLVDDGVQDPFSSDACEDILNPDDLAGKIALIDRGGCFFIQKTVNAEAAGAIACIQCNFEEAPMGMGGAPGFPSPGIPTVSLGSADCALIRQLIANGETVNLTIKQEDSNGPTQVDGDFDNGIIAHEYGHGISNRLTAGPSSAGCLGNQEQMGEGWSDFFTLITTVRAGDTGDIPKGIGNYADRKETDGRGIRPNPYSTDMSVNPATYNDINRYSIPHGLGYVWCSMIWDMYWAFVDVYGFDIDITNMDAGNNMAIQLVMDGMKLQPCGPGFVDGRDAILAADEILFDGANECLIWSVFARRGLGFGADQANPRNAGDGTASFEPLPECVKELKIKKIVSPEITAGDEIMVRVEVINHKDDSVPSTVVTDNLPSGLTFVGLDEVFGMDINDVVVNSNDPTMVTFDLGDIPSSKQISLEYRLISDASNRSMSLYLDDVPDNSQATADLWSIGFQGDLDNATNEFHITDMDAASPDYSWRVDDQPLDVRQLLQSFDPTTITGTNPVLRFNHKMQTQRGYDAGVVEVSNDNGNIFTSLSNELFRNGYNGSTDYQTFVIPNYRAFSGTFDFTTAYADLSQYNGEEVYFRFRFATNNDAEEGSSFDGDGWFIDDFELIDMVNYNSEACVSSGDGDNVCYLPLERGTIVGTDASTDVDDIKDANNGISVNPNPASDYIQISINSERNQNATVQLMSLDGKVVQSQNLKIYTGHIIRSMDISQVPSGIYFVQVQTNDSVVTEKLVIE